MKFEGDFITSFSEIVEENDFQDMHTAPALLCSKITVVEYKHILN